MDKMSAVAVGRDQATSMLWGMAADTNGLQIESEQRAQIVQQLRSLADSIERAPQNVVGLVLIAGEKVFGDEEGISSCVAITGTTPAIAASFCIFEEIGRDAMGEMLPHMLGRVIADAVAEGAAPEDLEVN
jgi:hypothetical protein